SPLPDAPDCLCLPVSPRSVKRYRTERRVSPARKLPVCGDRRPCCSTPPAGMSTPRLLLRRASLGSKATRCKRPSPETKGAAVHSLPRESLPDAVLLVILPADKVQ